MFRNPIQQDLLNDRVLRDGHEDRRGLRDPHQSCAAHRKSGTGRKWNGRHTERFRAVCACYLRRGNQRQCRQQLKSKTAFPFHSLNLSLPECLK